MPTETILSNARIVLEDEIVAGSVAIRDGLIADISAGGSQIGEDLEARVCAMGPGTRRAPAAVEVRHRQVEAEMNLVGHQTLLGPEV